MAVSLKEQATAVGRAAANLRGHIENLERLVSIRRRPQHELDTARAFLPGLEAATRTLRIAGSDERIASSLEQAVRTGHEQTG